MMKKYFAHTAFTLIEMLFIIVILGILLALSLSVFQQRGLNVKIDKTALQLQQLIQAANQYYADWNCWPNSTTCPGNAPDFNYYLPLGATNNPWGNPYQYGPDPNQTGNFLINSGDLITNQAATRVASVLPNAIINTGDNRQVLVSTQTQNINAISFQIFRAVTLSDLIPTFFAFQCPKGWQGSGTAIPIAISTDEQSCWYPNYYPPFIIILVAGSKLISNLNPTFTYPCTKIPGINQDTYNCNYMLHFTSNVPNWGNACKPDKNEGAGSVTFINIGYCIPPTQTQNQ